MIYTFLIVIIIQDMNKKKSHLHQVIEDTLKDAYSLLPDIIDALRNSDILAIKSNKKWTQRHRLMVLLTNAEINKKLVLENKLVDPFFLLIFQDTIELLKKWSTDPKWEELKMSMKNSGNFKHTIGKLTIAERFLKQSYKVKIIAKGKTKTPDIGILGKGVTNERDWLYLECYQPDLLVGKIEKLSSIQLSRIVNKTMQKARKQLGKHHSGILALFSYDQQEIILDILSDKFSKRLETSDRPYLVGILLFNTYIKQSILNENINYKSMVSTRFIPNLAYFGSIDFLTDDILNCARAYRAQFKRNIKQPI